MKSKKLTKRLITQKINELKFDPHSAGPLQAILDVGDPEYYPRRAEEFLKEGDLENAARMLVIALVLRELNGDDS